MDYGPLLTEIAMARGRDFTVEQVNAIAKQLERVGWLEAQAICRNLACSEKLPQNIYGAICNDVDDRMYQKSKALETAAWKTKDPKDCMTYKEYFWYFKIVAEIIALTREGIIKKNPSGCAPVAMDEWIRAGKPKTWNPLLDNLLDGSIPAYQETIIKGENENHVTALEIYFGEQYSKLQDWKKEKGILI